MDEAAVRAAVEAGRPADSLGTDALLACTYWLTCEDDAARRWLRALMLAVSAADQGGRYVQSVEALLILLSGATDPAPNARIVEAIAALGRIVPPGPRLAARVEALYPWHTRPAAEHAAYVRGVLRLCDTGAGQHAAALIAALLRRLLILDVEVQGGVSAAPFAACADDDALSDDSDAPSTLGDGIPIQSSQTALASPVPPREVDTDSRNQLPASSPCPSLEELREWEERERQRAQGEEGLRALDTCAALLASYLGDRLSGGDAWPPKTKRAVRRAVAHFFARDVVASAVGTRALHWVACGAARRDADLGDRVLGLLFRPLLGAVAAGGCSSRPGKRPRPAEAHAPPAIGRCVSSAQRGELLSAAHMIAVLCGVLPARLGRVAHSLLLRLALRMAAENRAMRAAGLLVVRARRELAAAVGGIALSLTYDAEDSGVQCDGLDAEIASGVAALRANGESTPPSFPRAPPPDLLPHLSSLFSP